MMRTVLCALT